MKIGIIKERKVPVDHRVAFTPDQCLRIMQYAGVELVVESSDVRCFSDEDYAAKGVSIVSDVSDCDVLFGVKEVPVENLIPGKRYFFFSHTIKKQPYNAGLLKSIVEKNIALADYECLVDDKGKRVVAFGRFAGIVGAYNGLRTYGLKYKRFTLKRPEDCANFQEMKDELGKVKLPAMRILVTGSGRVAKGAQEILDAAGITNVVEWEYMDHKSNEPIYIQLDSDAYNERKDGSDFDFQDFYQNPGEYKSTFGRFLPVTDMLIAGAYWDPKAPVLFTQADMAEVDFRIRVVADITCDIKGSIPSTVRPSTIADPIYDIDQSSGRESKAFRDLGDISVMAVDNLPCALPVDASESFGDQLLTQVVGALLDPAPGDIVDRATICNQGGLTDNFSYLSDFLAGAM